MSYEDLMSRFGLEQLDYSAFGPEIQAAITTAGLFNTGGDYTGPAATTAPAPAPVASAPTPTSTPSPAATPTAAPAPTTPATPSVSPTVQSPTVIDSLQEIIDGGPAPAVPEAATPTGDADPSSALTPEELAQRQQLIDQGIIDADGNLLVDMPSIGDMFSSGWDSFADTFQGLLDRTTEEAANREAVATAQLDAFRTQLTTFGQDQRAFEENLRAEAEVLREEQNPDAPELAGRVVKGGSALGIGSQFKANKKNTDLTDLRIN